MVGQFFFYLKLNPSMVSERERYINLKVPFFLAIESQRVVNSFHG
jgi:hypothetical protein